MTRFSGLHEAKDGVREAIRMLINLDAAESDEARMDVADLLGAWQQCNTQVERESEIRAETRAGGIASANPAGNVEARTMRAAFVELFGKVSRPLTPGRHFLGTKLEEIQDGEPQVELLEEVTNVQDGEDDLLISELTKEGQLKIRKGQARKVPKPRNSEELRTRHRLINHAWLFARCRHMGRVWLQDLDIATYNILSDHVLGEKVSQLESATLADGSRVRPRWELILSFEFHLRRQCYEWVRDAEETIHTGMARAIKDSETRELHFVAPFAQQLALAAAQQSSRRPPPVINNFNNSDGGGGRDRGGSQLYREHNGQPICYKFNSTEQTCDGSCGRLHICQRCLGDHPRQSPDCPMRGDKGGKNGKGGKDGKARGRGGRGKGRGRGKNK